LLKISFEHSRSPVFSINQKNKKQKNNYQEVLTGITDHIETEGIFRLAAGTNSMEAAQKLLDSGGVFDYESADTHVLAGLLKRFFRLLPEPLLTYSLYSSFIAVGDNDDTRAQFEDTKENLKKLPAANFKLLQYLLKFLFEVSTFSHKNFMETSNLAIVFGPILLHSCDKDYDAALQETVIVNDVVELMIKNHSSLFD